jgi:CRISPR/Cas system CMR-associated protein Cmr1 (group 7 of RAMP superfamily)
MWANLSCQKIYEEESKVFGSIDYGQGVRIFTRGYTELDKYIKKFEETDYQKYLYLGYGPVQLIKRKKKPDEINLGNPHSDEINVATSYNKNTCRDAIIPGERFPQFFFQATGTIDQIEGLKKTLLLLHLFGGLGARSRRGWGGVQVISEKWDFNKISFEEPSKGIQEALKLIWNDEQRKQLTDDLPSFTAFYKRTQILITDEANDYKAIFSSFFNRFQQVRLYRTKDNTPHFIAKKDHDNEYDVAHGGLFNNEKVPKRLAYGLPYQPEHRYSWSAKYYGLRPDSTDRIERRASPLFLKVFREKNKYYGIILFLKSQFFGVESTKIGVDTTPVAQQEENNLVDFSDYEAIDTFLNGFQKIEFFK